MISLLSIGDKDVLRDATRPSAIFWYRARTSTKLLVGAAVVTAIWLASLLLLVAGPALGFAWATPERAGVIFSFVAAGWLAYLIWMIGKFMPGRNDRVVLALRETVRTSIDTLDEQARALSDDQLRAKRQEFVQRLAAGASLDDVRAEAYACVREASRRARNHRQFECQLIGSKVIEDAKVAEMRTGEGKTIVCYAANYMKVLQGLRVHMVTVNDYLVRRDAEFCTPIFELLGVTVGYINSGMPTFGAEAQLRRSAYECDITYGTNSEFGFDYLRDNMKIYASDLVQGPQDFTVVDEVDSILIDEARTPLIISGAAHDDVRKYKVADNISRSLIRRQEQAVREFRERIDEVERDAPPQLRSDSKFRDGIKKFRSDPMWLSTDEAEAIGHTQYFVVEQDRKSAHMTEQGAKSAQAELGVGTFYDARNMNWPHLIDNSIRAHLCYQKDKEYVIQEDQIVIVDEFTGRLMHGRQWSDGLHQAVEAKEGVTVKQETQTLASITLQNLFKLYRQLAGMTGTAMTESDEFMRIYGLEVIAIPTNKPIRRVDFNDKLYRSVDSKYEAIVEEIFSYSHKGYPGDPWSLFDMLREVRRQVQLRLKAGETDGLADKLTLIDEALKTFNEGRGEAAALEQAYLKLAGEEVGARPVLVGTTSVENSEKLSKLLTQSHGIEHEVLNAKNHAREAEIVAKAGQRHEQVRGRNKELVANVTIATNMAGRGTDIVLGSGVPLCGGLHVIGTERHEARRIDNQLRGRCGRQGDPGSSRFFLSLEDDLLRLFMGEWVLRILGKYAFEEGVPIEHKQITRGIERAQKKVEERNFGIRKNLLEYDEVPDQQRKQFYALRKRVIHGEDLSGLIWEMIDEAVADAVNRFYDLRFPSHCVAEWASQHLGVMLDAEKIDTSDLRVLREQVREMAGYELRSTIQRTFGEYVDPDVDPSDWDIRGLVNWASQFGLTLTQRQVTEGEPGQIVEQIVEAAVQRVGTADLEPLETFVDKQFSRRRLLRWAQDKFGVEIPLEQLAQAQAEDAERLIGESMRASYKKREIEYPIRALLEYAANRGGSNLNAVHDVICRWANRKYATTWTYEHFTGKNEEAIFDELRVLNEDYLSNGKLDREVEAALTQHPGDAILDWAERRFGNCFVRSQAPQGPELVEHLRRCGYEMLRFELTQLERLVLLQTMDAVWKDHMYSMDLLRHGIGLRGYAERDPKIEFKREGTRLFNETQRSIRERVTDLIFKVQITTTPSPEAASRAAPAAPPPAPAADFAAMKTHHVDATGVGFASAAREQAQSGQPGQPPAADAGAATFRHAQPKVGRNDPCPCGSGKKFKQCHGKGRA